MQLASDFEDFIRLLNKHSVEYLVVGGYAMAFHGRPRFTGDLDIWINIAIAFIGLNQLIANKKASNRPQDVQDIVSLQKRKKDE